MKKLTSIFAGLFFLVLTFNAKAQSQSGQDYFAGKWNILIAGTPNGDSKMIVVFERKDGKFEGAVLDSTQKEISKFSKVEEKENSVTVYFTSQGYDVTLTLEKKDEDHVTGNMMDMFDAKGDRLKEAKAK